MDFLRARQILKAESIGKTDEEIKQILNLATVFADLVLEKAKGKDEKLKNYE